jgi:hypothetical protein
MRVCRGRLAALAFVPLLAACGGGGGDAVPAETESAPEDAPAERGTYLHVVMPSVVERGQKVDVRLRVVTQAGLPDYEFEGAFRIEAKPADVQFPENLAVEPMKEGWFRIADVVFPETGVHFIRGSVPGDTVQALANAFNVVENPEYRIYWGDLNGHSDLSSGMKAPGVYFWYGKAVGLLDFAVLTDNDREVTLQKVLDDVAFADITKTVAEEHTETGRFIGFVGFEWTSKEYGNRLVIFSETPAKLPTVAAGFDTPAKLAAALPAGSVMAIPHPSGSAMSPPVDPASITSEPLVEMCSTLGIFEAAGSSRPTTQETPGAFVQDLLGRGLRFGFLGTSDTRLSTPGNPRGITTEDHGYPGGITAVLAKDLTHEAILEALRARRCYATTGVRYLLEFTVDGAQMGSELRVPKGHRASLYGSLGSTSQWVRMEFIGPEGPVATLTPEGEADVIELTGTTPPVDAPTWVYLRGVDQFGGMAWSSPVFLIPE